MMPLQRACGAESQVRNKLSNGPLRSGEKQVVKWTAEGAVKCDRIRLSDRIVCQCCPITEYSATCRHTSVAGDMLVSC